MIQNAVRCPWVSCARESPCPLSLQSNLNASQSQAAMLLIRTRQPASRSPLAAHARTRKDSQGLARTRKRTQGLARTRKGTQGYGKGSQGYDKGMTRDCKASQGLGKGSHRSQGTQDALAAYLAYLCYNITFGVLARWPCTQGSARMHKDAQGCTRMHKATQGIARIRNGAQAAQGHARMLRGYSRMHKGAHSAL